jgi:uncharacterized protein (AIM24 family)
VPEVEAAAAPEADGSWEGLSAAEPVPEGAAVAQAWDATAEAGAEASASWEGVASAQAAPASDAAWESGAEDTLARVEVPPPAEPEPGAEAGPLAPEPGTFERVDGIHDTEWVMQPVSEALRGGGTPRPSAPPSEATIPPSLSVGFTPLKTQRLTELGATAAWVQEPSAGPFQLGPAGLAVSVHGEMLSRMTGLVAVVGSVESEPEMRHRRGRPTGEPFGAGGDQLQRVRGHGVLYLEATRSFHSIDLTDQPEEGLDDDGAYVREELVFAFEEGLSFDNGRLANETEALDLVHLKGNGRVLFRLEGDLNAMPIPAGTPTVVPVARLVGWFGRVTPRLTGFGGQGAVELTGEGYALLLT